MNTEEARKGHGGVVFKRPFGQNFRWECEESFWLILYCLLGGELEANQLAWAVAKDEGLPNISFEYYMTANRQFTYSVSELVPKDVSAFWLWISGVSLMQSGATKMGRSFRKQVGGCNSFHGYPKVPSRLVYFVYFSFRCFPLCVATLGCFPLIKKKRERKGVQRTSPISDRHYMKHK